MGNATVLLLGSGGREHALAWKLAQSDQVDRIIAVPGNPGMAEIGETRSADIENPDEMLELAKEVEPDLIVVGPEAPIAAGVSDALREAGHLVFGPSKEAGRLEWDKAYAKEFMVRQGVPTAASRTFDHGDLDEAREYVREHSLPVVLKASGLAAGKGVVIAESVDKALEILEEMLSGDAFGDAGRTVVVEEFMEGEEASIFAVTDGEKSILFAPSQDHKRVGDGDTGPNTGGMGAYAPAPIVTEAILEEVRSAIIEPTLAGMRNDGNRYTGCLFIGLMIADGKPRVVEFNCRFGDPETQVVLPLYNGDLYELFRGAAEENLAGVSQAESNGSAVCVVVASGGYPDSYEKGKPINGAIGVKLPEGVTIFQAGTKESDGQLVTSGGRVLGVTAILPENNLEKAIGRAYEGVEKITFDGMYYRRDIGAKAIDSNDEQQTDS